MTPNGSRLLFEWGLRDELERIGAEPRVRHRRSDSIAP